MYIKIPDRDGTGPGGQGPKTGKMKWGDRCKAEEMKTIVMEGPNKTNTWWRSKKKGKNND